MHIYIGNVLVKMDIEGEEFALLPTLISTGVACAGIDAILTEFHVHHSRRFMGDAMREEAGQDLFNVSAAHTLKESMNLLLQVARHATKGLRKDNNDREVCRTKLLKYDDESYQRATFARKALPPFPGAPRDCYVGGGMPGNPECVLTKPPEGMSRIDHAQHVIQGKKYVGLHSGEM